MYSYTSSLCSSSKQYPISFTKCGCLNCPRNTTSVSILYDPVHHLGSGA
ncbi:hypothetical protein HanXRQr2_Chr04g0189031 [Helianthus annuus]|uniref:Uncharacterized protein n=1 Tax=Helianthus annuus TaxID=4232 RepID=A0A9K3NTF7_HELAN|nr:hypothetical protein HanXRQr2_Chr04g0189031 [Helianthus annuus]